MKRFCPWRHARCTGCGGKLVELVGDPSLLPDGRDFSRPLLMRCPKCMHKVYVNQLFRVCVGFLRVGSVPLVGCRVEEVL